jgi:hypothetical protein
MKVAGFSFIRNAVKYDYPIIEAITSILPLCDKFVVAVGNSDDNTLDIIRNIDTNKIKIVETVWDDSLREGGKVLAVETNKAFQAIADDADWCFYIQGDEVMHEKYHDTVYSEMKKWTNRQAVDGLLFKYIHFYGSYDYIGSSPRWYPREIRVVRNNKKIYSFRDAQGFRKDDNQILRVKPIDAYIYHYGWVKDPRSMQAKQESFNKLWHSDEWIDRNVVKTDQFDYSVVDALTAFKGTHPQVMQPRIEAKNWKFDHDLSMNRLSIKDRFKKTLIDNFNIEIGYKNYRII